MIPDGLGQVRLLISDVSADCEDRIFSDLQVETFLQMAGRRYADSQAVVYGAAADALRSVAANQVIERGVTAVQDVSVNGATESAALLKLAGEYEGEAGRLQASADAAVVSPASRFRFRVVSR